MKNNNYAQVFAAIALLLFAGSSAAEVAYFQYRVVPNDRDAEFVEKETKYWSKVAAAAIDQGHMKGWSLWRKVGVTEEGAPNYVLINNYESLEKMDPSKVWSEENVKSMGMDSKKVETDSFTQVAFDYYLQLESEILGDSKYVIVNYAKPENRSDFIEENKELWMPVLKKNIASGTGGMTGWGLMSVIYPTGKQGRFSSLTYDGFATLADALAYSYDGGDSNNDGGMFADILDKSKMDEILPGGFEYRIIYERVMSLTAKED